MQGISKVAEVHKIITKVDLFIFKLVNSLVCYILRAVVKPGLFISEQTFIYCLALDTMSVIANKKY